MERELRVAVGRTLNEREKYILWSMATNSLTSSATTVTRWNAADE